MKRRPVAYLVRQAGLKEFSEVAYTKKQAAYWAWKWTQAFCL